MVKPDTEKLFAVIVVLTVPSIVCYKVAEIADGDNVLLPLCQVTDLDESMTLLRDKCFDESFPFNPVTVADVIPEGSICSVECTQLVSRNSWVKCNGGILHVHSLDCAGESTDTVMDYHSRPKRSFWAALIPAIVPVVEKVICWLICDDDDKQSECEKNPTPPKFNNCPPPIKYTHENGFRAVAAWGKPTASGRGVKISQSPSGLLSGNTFERGHTIISYKATDQCGRSDFCILDINVEVISCYAELTNTDNLRYHCPHQEVVYGDACTFSCEMGYVLQTPGNNVLTCQKNEKFDKRIPVCEVVTCPSLKTNVISNGHYDMNKCTDENRFMSVCHITCDDGYRPNYHSVMICLKTGAWSGAVDPVSSCIDTVAPTFDSCPSATIRVQAGENSRTAIVTWDEPTASDNSGPISVTQTGGPPRNSDQMQGMYVIQYEAEDGDGNRALPCMFVVQIEVVTCDASTLFIQDGTFSCDSSDKIYGTTCSFRCEEGYSIQGSDTTKCLSTGLFSNTPPVCEKISCQDPNTSGSHGEYLLADCSDGFKYESYCIPTCDDGYRPTVTSFIRCRKDGSWTRSIRPCEDYQLPVIDNCPRSGTFLADPNSNQATVWWPLVTATDNSGIVNVYQLDGVANNTAVTEGIYTIRITAEDGSGNKARSCVFTLNVEVLKCSLSEYLMDRYAALNCTNTKPIRGTVCGISCWDRATLQGADTITCETNSPSTDGVWTWDGATKPRCDPPNNTCTDLNAPVNGAISCGKYAHGAFFCEPACNANYDVAPLNGLDVSVFVCSLTTQTWRPLSSVPDCTETRIGTRMRLKTQFYYYTGDCSDASVLQTIKENFITNLNNSNFRSACGASCTVENVNVRCGAVTGRKKRELQSRIDLEKRGNKMTKMMRARRKRSTSFRTIVGFDLVKPVFITSTSDDYSEVDALLRHGVEQIKTESSNGSYDVNINGQKLDAVSTSFTYDWSSVDCQDGYVQKGKETLDCVSCPAGFYFHDGKCNICPIGTYQKSEGQLECLSCPPNTSTLETGAKNNTYCKETCPPGSFSTTGFLPCDVCKQGTYSENYKSTRCASCAAGYTTEMKGASSLRECREFDLGIEAGSIVRSLISTVGISNFTFVFWMYVDGNTTNNIVFQSSHGKVSLSFGTELRLMVAGTEGTSTMSVQNHEWHHFTIVNHAVTKQTYLFVNGQEVIQLTGNQSLTLEPAISLEIQSGSSDIILNGLFLIATPLTTTEVLDLSSTCTPLIPVYYLSINEFLSINNSRLAKIVPSQCDGVNECESSPCGEHAMTCVNKIGGYDCLCQDGYTGDSCGIPPDHCIDNECAHGATCKSEERNYTCICAHQYKGPLCEQLIIDGQWGEWLMWSQCSTSCNPGTRERRRLCDNPSPQLDGKPCEGEASQQESCEIVKCPKDCSSSPCGPNSICIEKLDGNVCQCINDYTGENCDLPPNFCNGHACQNGATCIPQIVQRNYTCQCNTGFTGDLCDSEIVYGGWTDWSDWLPCSVTCGGGVHERRRKCTNPAPNAYGRACDGAETENGECSIAKCPECPLLPRPIDGETECNKTDDVTTCRAFCHDNYAFPPGQLSIVVYCGRATGYVWTDDSDGRYGDERTVRLPACGEIKKPKSLEVKGEAKYQTTPCSGISKCEEAKGTLKAKANQLKCVRDNICTADIKFQQPDSRVKRSTGDTIQILFSSVYSSRDTTWSVDSAEREGEVNAITTTIESLEETARWLVNNTSEFLQLDIGGVVYEVDETSLTFSGTAICEEGSVSYGGVCVVCPIGTRKEGDRCVTCERGTYQERSGAAVCNQCPSGFTSVSTGSEHIDQCAVEVDGTGEDGETDFMKIIIPVAVLAGIIAFTLVIAIVYLLKRKKRPHRKSSLVYPKHFASEKVEPNSRSRAVNEYVVRPESVRVQHKQLETGMRPPPSYVHDNPTYASNGYRSENFYDEIDTILLK